MAITNLNKLFYGILITTIIILGLRLLNTEPKTTTHTTIDYKQIVDSIQNAYIKLPDTVYIDTIKGKINYIKGKDVIKWRDSLIYIDTSGIETPIVKAQEYPAVLKANNATANLSILTTGKLLGVQGVINYQEKVKTIEVVKYKNNSGLFLYGETSVIPQFQQYKVGLDYTIRNSIIVGTSIGYDTKYNSGIVNVKFGIRIF